MMRPSARQYEALAALAAAPLARCTHGWCTPGGRVFTNVSIRALARRGWVNVTAHAGRGRTASITAVGRITYHRALACRPQASAVDTRAA